MSDFKNKEKDFDLDSFAYKKPIKGCRFMFMDDHAKC